MSLGSKKVGEIRRYAKALGIHVGFSDEDGQHYKKKSVLLHEINEKVNMKDCYISLCSMRYC